MFIKFEELSILTQEYDLNKDYELWTAGSTPTKVEHLELHVKNKDVAYSLIIDGKMEMGFQKFDYVMFELRWLRRPMHIALKGDPADRERFVKDVKKYVGLDVKVSFPSMSSNACRMFLDIKQQIAYDYMIPSAAYSIPSKKLVSYETHNVITYLRLMKHWIDTYTWPQDGDSYWFVSFDTDYHTGNGIVSFITPIVRCQTYLEKVTQRPSADRMFKTEKEAKTYMMDHVVPQAGKLNTLLR